MWNRQTPRASQCSGTRATRMGCTDAWVPMAQEGTLAPFPACVHHFTYAVCFHLGEWCASAQVHGLATPQPSPDVLRAAEPPRQAAPSCHMLSSLAVRDPVRMQQNFSTWLSLYAKRDRPLADPPPLFPSPCPPPSLAFSIRLYRSLSLASSARFCSTVASALRWNSTWETLAVGRPTKRAPLEAKRPMSPSSSVRSPSALQRTGYTTAPSNVDARASAGSRPPPALLPPPAAAAAAVAVATAGAIAVVDAAAAVACVAAPDATPPRCKPAHGAKSPAMAVATVNAAADAA
eukprot:359081-Chlamydomonas_euryale.AAC.11